MEELVIRLFDIDAVKLGSFKLKSGFISPIYVDLRVIISFPDVLQAASNMIWDVLQHLDYSLICGVPYTALPVASSIASNHAVRMVMKRKEPKDYGTQKILEGCFKKGERCVIIEDVVTSGSSILETATCLSREGLVVTDAICLLDRTQGGQENLQKHNIRLHSLLNMSTLLQILHKAGKIDDKQLDSIQRFVSENQIERNMVVNPVEDIILRLHEIGSFRFGSFKLSNGMITPIYVDLRLVVSYPLLMSDICKQLYNLVQDVVEFDIICGVPMAALHLATCMAKDQQLVNVLLRKEVKDYGTRKLIEGVYKPGQRCLIVEDVMVSGQGIHEASQILNAEGLVATDAVLVLDREQQGEENLKKLGINLHCLIKVSDALDVLVRHKKINADIANEVKTFLHSNPTQIPPTKKEADKRTSKINEPLSFEERAKLCKNPISRKLFEIMTEKHSNLCVSADYTRMEDLVQLADKIGGYICMLKTHVDLLEDFTLEGMMRLKELAQKHNFLLFEDRKFSDIGYVVQQQYNNGMYKISQWADIVTAHSLPGPHIIDALKPGSESVKQACLLVAEMSSAGNLINASYSVATVNMARENDFVIGIISQSKLTSEPTLIHITPGVSFSCKGDGLGQQHVTPEDAVLLRGADVVIVGRGITQAVDVVQTTKEYQLAAYNAYEKLRLLTSMQEHC